MKAPSRRSLRTVAVLLILLAVLAPIRHAEAGGGGWYVNTVDDLDDGTCNSEHCSLREAINIANAVAGTQLISFEIPGPGPHIIELCTALPPITESVIINGEFEPDYPYMGGPVVAVTPSTSSGCSAPAYGFWVDSGSASFEALSIAGFNQPAAAVSGGIIYAGGSGNLIEDNYIGLLPGGAPFGNYNGILLGTSGHTVRGNVIAGNTYGVHATAGNHHFQQNYIGTDTTATSTGPNLRNTIGIYIEAGADGNTIGWSGVGNVISGNGDGIYLGSQGNQIYGNLIGTDITGTMALGNSIGVHASEADYTVIGSPASGDRNVISGNTTGISLGGYSTVQNNLIGTDISGTAAIPNQIGLTIQAATYDLIGGTGTNQSNVFSGNSNAGIILHDFASHIEVVSNLIGTDITGTSALGNGRGIFIQGSGNFIGHVATAGGNTIAYNTDEGVLLGWSASDNVIEVNTIHHNGVGIYAMDDTTTSNAFTQNLIHNNVSLGIDLAPWGVTANDYADTDTGANTLRNFPLLNVISTTDVQGSACPNCTVEVFLADSDPSGHGEGAALLGTTVAGPAGDWYLAFGSPLAVCDKITATATDDLGNTSEFSQTHFAGACYSFDPSWLFLVEISIFIIIWFAVYIVGRRRGRPTGPAAGIGAAVGLAAAAGAFGLMTAIPNIQVNTTPMQPAVEEPGLPPCESFLTRGSLLPSEGMVGMPPEPLGDEGFMLSWLPDDSVMNDGQPGDEVTQWQVDLIPPSTEMTSQTTADNAIPLSTFGVDTAWLMDDGEQGDGMAGESFLWRLTGLGEADDGSLQPLCVPTNWIAFQLSEPETQAELPSPVSQPPPEEEPAPEDEDVEETTCEPQVTAQMNMTCRFGPASEYEELGYLLEGETSPVEGRNAEGTWWYIPNPDWQGFCWIWDGGVEAECIPDDVRVIIPPALPTPTPPPCSRDLGQEDCEAAGGTYIEGQTDVPICVCPD